MADPIALVTGGARRLGRAIAVALAARGYAVIVHHRRSREEAEAVAQSIRATGGQAATASADLADAVACARLIADAGAHFGPLTALVNNASLFLHDTALDLAAAQWDLQLAVNLRAPALLARDFARQLPEDTRGAIVNLLDCKVANLHPGYLSYSVSKAGLAAATELLARALAPRIRVNAIAPGLVLPSGGQSQAEFRAVHDRNPLRRGTSPEDVALAVVQLLEAAAITGQVLHVDGGERFTEGTLKPARGATSEKP